MLQHPRQENIRLSSIASRLRSEGISQNTRDSPSTQLYCCRKRYLPFPYPVTGSMIPCSAISRSKAVHLVGFFKSVADVQYLVMKRMILVQQEISFVPYRRRFCTRLKECNRVFPGNTPKQHAFSHSPNSRLKSRECGE